MNVSVSTKIVVISVFVIYTISLLIIGWIYKKRQDKISVDKYVDHFYTGGRAMHPLLLAMMVAAGICSAGTFLGSPGSTYKIGSSWGIILNSQMLINLIVLGVVGKKIAIVSRRRNIKSFVGLLYDRYNNNKFLALLACATVLLFVGYYTASQFIGGGRLFEVMTGMPYWVGLVAFTIVVCILAAFAGIHGVAAATVVQGAVMTFSTFMLLFLGFGFCGGESAFREIAATTPDLASPSAVYSPLMMLSYCLIFGFFTTAFPHAIIGCFTYKSTHSMHTAIKIGIVVVGFWSLGLTLVSLIIRNAFPNLAVSDYALPTLAVTALPSWVSGLVLAGVVGALQSTVATMVIVMSASVVKDIYQTMIKPNVSFKIMKNITNVSTMIITLVIFALALNPPDNLQTIIIYANGGLVSAFYVPLMLGIYWMRATEWGALAGMTGGLLVYLLNGIGILHWTMGMVPQVVGVLTSLVLTIVISFLTPKTPYSIIDSWFSRIPKASKD